MEAISDNFGGTKRTVDLNLFYKNPPFASLRIWEELSSILTIRFNPGKKEDLVFFDQLRAALEQLAEFMRP
jgi:hypothetical protein